MIHWMIDGHLDLAYSALAFGRDLFRSVDEIREMERGTLTPQRNNGECTVAVPELQKAHTALVIASLFVVRAGVLEAWETQVYRTPQEARQRWTAQLDVYRRWCEDHPAIFRQVTSRRDLQQVIKAWQAFASAPAPGTGEEQAEHPASAYPPIGLVVMMEGAEGLREPREIEEYAAQGVRLVAPVWAGGRFCGSNRDAEAFTREGWELLDVLADLGMGLDLAHMNEKSSLQALDRFEGNLCASHTACRALARQDDNQRLLSDLQIRRIVERNGVIGIALNSRWLRPGWSAGDPRESTTLKHVAAHVDHICQIAGDARHVALGTDLDGGFGRARIPAEVESIADLPKLADILAEAGYNESDLAAIFGGNWQIFLERILPL